MNAGTPGAPVRQGLGWLDLLLMLGVAWLSRLALDAGLGWAGLGARAALREPLLLGAEAAALAAPALAGARCLRARRIPRPPPAEASWGLQARLLTACLGLWVALRSLGDLTGGFHLRLVEMPADPWSWLRLIILGGLGLVLHRAVLQRGLAPRLGPREAMLAASLLATLAPLDPLLWILLRCGDPLPWPAWWTVVSLQARACVALAGPSLATGWIYRRTGRLGPAAAFHYTWFLGLAVAGCLPGAIPFAVAALGLALLAEALTALRPQLGG